ncbi:MAG: uracil phosphoribosyltransferase [Bdellovibrionaceae bacterium]|nr:uracil phosphoribosyltransferase [Pseudobdellovibrionaceae bacterium]MDW8189851.1 uracil phosphoribosyltransferase [Pseudobdellovibrionaceae bacterium]
MWLEHRYGPQVAICNSPLAHSWLSELCSQECRQPRLNQLMHLLYTHLLSMVIEQEFPVVTIKQQTRMASQHPNHAQITTQVIRHHTRAITVNLARAGTFPSHICYELLNQTLDPSLVRQDHIFAARTANAQHQVTGTDLGAHKIGGDKEGAIVIFPDPMGATGHTLQAALDHYLNHIEGTALKFIAAHLIVTPEYLKRITVTYPQVKIYAYRVDRGLSHPSILAKTPGEDWEQEKGLNDYGYIVPGAGGLGELLNNSPI